MYNLVSKNPGALQGVFCANTNANISGGTIDNNTAWRGAGICLSGSSGDEIRDTTIAYNTASGDGGGIECHSFANGLISNCIITSNSAGSGGGISCDGASPSISACTISGNTASVGGGLDLDYYTAEIFDTRIIGNTANEGGGVKYRGNSVLTINKSSISGNCAVSGGGIHNYGNYSLITNSEISYNYAEDGGGMYYTGGAEPTITNCILLGNSAVNDGGGIYSNTATLYLYNCLIGMNMSQSYGGGINSELTLYTTQNEFVNCNFVDNSSEQGGGIYLYYAYSTISNSIIWDNADDQIGYDYSIPDIDYTCISGGFEGEGNIDSDPLFCPGSYGEYYLSQTASGQTVNSPCLDAGSDISSNLCFNSSPEEICLDHMTTRSDNVLDLNQVDIGFHYLPIPTSIPTSTPTSTSSPSQTPTFTSSPAFTATPTPWPTSTPTTAPTDTVIPSVTPTFSPSSTPENSPTPTATPEIITPTPSTVPTTCAVTGATIWMPATEFHPGDACSCIVTVCNSTGFQLNGFPLFVTLDVFGSYYFAPSFSNYDQYSRAFDTGETVIDVIPSFSWPSGNGNLNGITWYAALTDPAITQLFGQMDTWTFSWSE